MSQQLGLGFDTRAGLEIGPGGEPEPQEHGVVGETPNVAARLQSIANPNTVVVAESTRRLLGNLFELQELGAKNLKGIGSQGGAWAARQSRAVSRKPPH
jgi:class 3 adenylate cyclase